MNKKHVLSAISILLISACSLVISCNSGKNGSAEADALNSDTIPFFTTVKKMMDFKNDIIKKFGKDAQINEINFERDYFTVKMKNEKEKKMETFDYTNGKFDDKASNIDDSSPDSSWFFKPGDIPVTKIPFYLKSLKKDFVPDNKDDSLQVTSISMTKIRDFDKQDTKIVGTMLIFSQYKDGFAWYSNMGYVKENGEVVDGMGKKLDYKQ